MSEIESPRYSYVRCSYEVMPTESVLQFHALISEIISNTIPSRDFAVLQDPGSLDRSGAKAGHTAKLIPVKFQPYPINSWRFTVFEQPMLRSRHNNLLLSRLFNTLNDNEMLFDKLEKIAGAASTEEDAGIEVTVNAVHETTKLTDAHLGKEYGTAATGMSPGIAMLLEQSGVFYGVAKSLGVGSEIIDTEPAKEVAVPFVRLPRGTAEPVAKAFIASVQEAIPKDGLDILFRPELSFLPNIRRAMDRH